MKRWFLAMASLEFTLLSLALVLAGGVAVAMGGVDATWGMSAPMLLCAINLSAALLVHERLRQQGGLFVFHCALLMFLLLVPVSRLTYMKGAATVVTGESFTGKLLEREQGAWHGDHLPEAGFRNDGFHIDYAPGIKRRETRNQVSWEEEGVRVEAVIGDNLPLVRHGYRFYTTANKGFAALFQWQKRGELLPARGAIRFQAPSQTDLTADWELPGSDLPVHLRLEFLEPVIDPEQGGSFPALRPFRLEALIHGQLHLLQPGLEVQLPEGSLLFEGLRPWMGYAVFYDWTRPWLLASILVGVGGLSWHYRRRVFGAPWRPWPEASAQERA